MANRFDELLEYYNTDKLYEKNFFLEPVSEKDAEDRLRIMEASEVSGAQKEELLRLAQIITCCYNIGKGTFTKVDTSVFTKPQVSKSVILDNVIVEGIPDKNKVKELVHFLESVQKKDIDGYLKYLPISKNYKVVYAGPLNQSRVGTVIRHNSTTYEIVSYDDDSGNDINAIGALLTDITVIPEGKDPVYFSVKAYNAAELLHLGLKSKTTDDLNKIVPLLGIDLETFNDWFRMSSVKVNNVVNSEFIEMFRNDLGIMYDIIKSYFGDSKKDIERMNRIIAGLNALQPSQMTEAMLKKNGYYTARNLFEFYKLLKSNKGDEALADFLRKEYLDLKDMLDSNQSLNRNNFTKDEVAKQVLLECEEIFKEVMVSFENSIDKSFNDKRNQAGQMMNSSGGNKNFISAIDGQSKNITYSYSFFVLSSALSIISESGLLASEEYTGEGLQDTLGSKKGMVISDDGTHASKEKSTKFMSVLPSNIQNDIDLKVRVKGDEHQQSLDGMVQQGEITSSRRESLPLKPEIKALFPSKGAIIEVLKDSSFNYDQKGPLKARHSVMSSMINALSTATDEGSAVLNDDLLSFIPGMTEDTKKRIVNFIKAGIGSGYIMVHGQKGNTVAEFAEIDKPEVVFYNAIPKVSDRKDGTKGAKDIGRNDTSSLSLSFYYYVSVNGINLNVENEDKDLLVQFRTDGHQITDVRLRYGPKLFTALCNK